MPRRTDQELHERRREQILNAAAVRFAADGFHRTSMQDVIAEAEMSPGAVYRYFTSKDEIIAAIVHQSMGTVADVVHASLHAATPLAEVVATLPVTLGNLQMAEARIRLAVQSWGESLRNPTLGDAMRSEAGRIRDALADRIRRGQSDGELRADVEADEIARTLLGLLQGFLLQHAWQSDLDPRAYGNACRSLVDGLAAPVPTPPRSRDRTHPAERIR